jgi:hypothetical protein
MKNNYPLKNLSLEQKKEAYKFACDTRKFEIELYWKRAAYFWGFLIISFGGYLIAIEKLSPHNEYKLIISLIGLAFSFCWYLVNRASKFWQENWEAHIDFLEDDIAGPIYKTPIDNSSFKFFKLNAPYSFSVSKINQILSLYVTIIWLFLISQNISEVFNLVEPFTNFNIIVLVIITISFIVYILIGCKSNMNVKNIKFNSRK